jgi:hypothetical protein
MPSTLHSMPVAQTDARNAGSSPEAPAARRSYYRKGVYIATGIGVLVLSSAAFYRVRELLAGLILFSLLFGALIFVILILWLVGETTHKAAAVLETHMPHILPHSITPAPAHSHPVHRGQPWN